VQMARKRKLILTVLLFELVIHGLLVVVPRNGSWVAPIIPFIFPGVVLAFIVGGGMSVVDGLSPDWRIGLGLVLGFLLNTTLMLGFCLLVNKIGRGGHRAPDTDRP
jgi:hypothetical protein